MCEDVDEAARLLRGRGAHGKLTPALVRFIKRRYRSLRPHYRNYRAIIAEDVLDAHEVSLSGETLRRVFREADREDEAARQEPCETSPKMATGCTSDENLSSNTAISRNQSPETPDIETVPFGRALQSARPLPVHHAGLVLFKTLKDWCGSRHGVAKTMHMDFIHSESGRPCFAQHYSPYYDLRER